MVNDKLQLMPCAATTLASKYPQAKRSLNISEEPQNIQKRWAGWTCGLGGDRWYSVYETISEDIRIKSPSMTGVRSTVEVAEMPIILHLYHISMYL